MTILQSGHDSVLIMWLFSFAVVECCKQITICCDKENYFINFTIGTR